MPKRGAFALGLTAFALALLLNFQTPTEVPALSSRGTGSAAGTGSTGAAPGTGSTTGGAGTSSGAKANATGTRTVTGQLEDTRFGPVQVAITLNGTQIVDVTAVALPSGGRSGQISNYVEPILRSEALQVQGSNIDGVSGATFTSMAYAQSLQAALDSAGS